MSRKPSQKKPNTRGHSKRYHKTAKAHKTKVKKTTVKKVHSSLGRRLVIYCAALAIWGLIIMLGVIGWYARDLPDTSALNTITKRPSVVILSPDGDILANYGDLYGDYLTYHQFPDHLINALIATEDRRFYHHIGIDILGLARAAWRNWQAGRIVEGGSTITQQLAKNLFLSPERTIRRKVQELVLSLWLEYQFTKEEILAIYLNRVYLGAGTYGADAAAKRYFNKEVTDINLWESAMIVGLLKAPSRYSPTNNPDLAEARTRQVLANMQHAGFLPDEPIAHLLATPPESRSYSGRGHQNYYFADWIMEQLPDYLGRIEQDIEVVTTLDPGLQHAADNALQQLLEEQGHWHGVSQAAALVMTPDGAIRAMIGGRHYQNSQFNRATQARRQPGSAFKLFPYLAALENGATPSDIWLDEPVSVGRWQPGNYENRHIGAVRLDDALAKSINTIAVQVNEWVGYDATETMARRLGITSPIQRTPSMALGVNEVTLLELTGAYAHVAHGGYSVWPYGIISIRTSDGQQLYKRLTSPPAQLLASDTVLSMQHMLYQVVNQGTGRRAQMPGWQVAGKTGTSQDYRDGWFIGFTSELVGGVWLGNDNAESMRDVTGGTLPAELWQRIMTAAHEDKTPRRLDRHLNPADARAGLPWQPLPWEKKQPQAPSRSLWDALFGE